MSEAGPLSPAPAPAGPPEGVAWTLPLGELGWIPRPQARILERLELRTVEDLLHHFPRRHEDRRTFAAFPREAGEEPLCLCGTVSRVSVSRFGFRNKRVEVTLEEEGSHALSGRLVCRWFNVHYIQKVIAVGQRLVVYGKPKLAGRRIVMDHPEFEVVEAELSSIHLGRITPVHPATEGITPRMLRGWIHRLLAEARPPGAGPLPADLAGMPYPEAVRTYHFPESWEALHRARRELVLTEFFRMQLIICDQRREEGTRPGAPHCGPGELARAFAARLPFALTEGQRRAIEAIRADLLSARPMNRLLHGDVGSGKTVVALSAMLLAVEAGFPAVLMAPTQILAEQHYLHFKRWLEPLGVPLVLRTGNRKGELLPLFEGSRPPVYVGTHALLYEEGLRPGLVVIDEQHKFGVRQRAALMEGEVTPDLLVMSATPIPRTLTMTRYGHLDVSRLDEAPAGRGRVVTLARSREKLPEAIAFIRKQIEAGRQAYVVYPLIDESERSEARAAAAEFERWREAFAPHRCDLLHGRLPPEEKEAVMERFRRNESRLLVATSVIEVGVDVSNATVMLVENAERFGLAQLHQLRGRIGRGAHKAYCILIHEAQEGPALEKMETLEQTSDGFRIAEADFRFRGAGDLLGTAQSGLPGVRLGDFVADAPWMLLARRAAIALFSADPELVREENRPFREWIGKNRHRELARIS